MFIVAHATIKECGIGVSSDGKAFVPHIMNVAKLARKLCWGEVRFTAKIRGTVITMKRHVTTRNLRR